MNIEASRCFGSIWCRRWSGGNGGGLRVMQWGTSIGVAHRRYNGGVVDDGLNAGLVKNILCLFQSDGLEGMGSSQLFGDLSRGSLEDLEARRADEMDADSSMLEILGHDVHGLVLLHTDFLGVDGHVADAVLIHAQGGVEAGFLLDDTLGVLERVPQAIVKLTDTRQMGSPFGVRWPPRGIRNRGHSQHVRARW